MYLDENETERDRKEYFPDKLLLYDQTADKKFTSVRTE